MPEERQCIRPCSSKIVFVFYSSTVRRDVRRNITRLDKQKRGQPIKGPVLTGVFEIFELDWRALSCSSFVARAKTGHEPAVRASVRTCRLEIHSGARSTQALERAADQTSRLQTKYGLY